MSITTQTTGIIQSDIIIRAALTKGIENIRANPWLLNFCFAGVPQDGATLDEYGDADVAQAKAWFMKSKIPVLMAPRIANPPSFPCVTFKVLQSSESEVTLADKHYDPTEFNTEQPPLTSPFDPGYDPSTGIMTLPSEVSQQLVTAAGQLVVDRGGIQHPILSAPDDATVVLDKGLVADFHGAFIVGRSPGTATSLESATFREVVAIGCHVQGEVAHLLYLHSIVVFCLLVYRESLLEARGWERSSISSGEAELNSRLDVENVFSRPITLSGVVRNIWPKGVFPTVSSSTGLLVISDAGKLGLNSTNSSFVGDGDPEGLSLEEDSLSDIG